MGIRCAPAYFESFSTFIEYCVRERIGSNKIVHYVDDFLCVGSIQNEELTCKQVVDTLILVCKELGVPLAKEKLEGFIIRLIFLGLELDLVLMQVRVPQEKLVEIRRKIGRALAHKSATVKEIQSLIGSLNFICRAVRPGRAFLRRLIDLIKGKNVKSTSIMLNEGAQVDLIIWLEFLNHHNGISVIPQEGWGGDNDHVLYTDASGEIGFGAYFEGKWFNNKWSSREIIEGTLIAWKEMIPILLSIAAWGEELQNRRIVLDTDNMLVKFIINKQTLLCSKIMELLRKFVLICLKKNIVYKAVYVHTLDNGVADSLSRFRMGRFRKLAPGARDRPSRIPTGIVLT